MMKLKLLSEKRLPGKLAFVNSVKRNIGGEPPVTSVQTISNRSGKFAQNARKRFANAQIERMGNTLEWLEKAIRIHENELGQTNNIFNQTTV